MAALTAKLLQTAPGPTKRQGLFKLIANSRTEQPPRIVLYGVQGVGKSTWASQAPSPIFLPTESGIESLDVQSFPLLSSWEGVQEACESLLAEEHAYQTLVLDSLDRLENLIWTDVCTEHRVKSIEEIGYAKGYIFALSRWNWFLQVLDALRSQRKLAIILIGHAKIERFESPDTQTYDRYGLRLHKHASGLVQEWADHVLFACYEVFVKTEKGKFGSDRGKAVGQGNRIMRTTERPFASAKNRAGLPDEMPLDWNTFAQHLVANKQGAPSQNG